MTSVELTEYTLSAWMARFYNNHKHTDLLPPNLWRLFDIHLRGAIHMAQATATREQLTSAAVTLHYPLNYYFNLFVQAKEGKRRIEAQSLTLTTPAN
jgi:hypothetical protein